MNWNGLELPNKKYQIIYVDLLEKLWYCLGDYLCRHKKHHWHYRYCSRCGIDIFIFQAIERRDYEKYKRT